MLFSLLILLESCPCAQFLSFREREFVLAARAIGASHVKVIFKEILPNAVPPAVVVASILVARAILLEAGLSFLGATPIS